jgi:hypothetical protein
MTNQETPKELPLLSDEAINDITSHTSIPDGDIRVLKMLLTAQHDADAQYIQGQVAEAVKKERERIFSKMQLEQCDPDVMAYFNDYYWIDEADWQALQSGEAK